VRAFGLRVRRIDRHGTGIGMSFGFVREQAHPRPLRRINASRLADAVLDCIAAGDGPGGQLCGTPA
jgi:hypothetical protein